VYNTSSFPTDEGSTGRDHLGLTRRRRVGILGHSCERKWEERRTPTTRGRSGTETTVHGSIPSDSIIQQMLDLYSWAQSCLLTHLPMCLAPSLPPTTPSARISFPDTLSESEKDIFYALQNLSRNVPLCFMPLFHNGGKPYAASFSWTYDVIGCSHLMNYRICRFHELHHV